MLGASDLGCGCDIAAAALWGKTLVTYLGKAWAGKSRASQRLPGISCRGMVACDVALASFRQ